MCVEHFPFLESSRTQLVASLRIPKAGSSGRDGLPVKRLSRSTGKEWGCGHDPITLASISGLEAFLGEAGAQGSGVGFVLALVPSVIQDNRVGYGRGWQSCPVP